MSDHFRIAESAALEQKFIETYLTRHNITSPPGDEAAELQNLDVFVENSGRGTLARSISKAFKKSSKAKFTASTKVLDGNAFLGVGNKITSSGFMCMVAMFMLVD